MTKIITIVFTLVLILLGIVLYKDLNFKFKYKDDPDTKQEWFKKGYDAGIDSGKFQEYISLFSQGRITK